jgi:hypothetical protein
MSDLYKAIRAIHNNVVTINGDSKTDIVAGDASGNDVTINWTDVEAWTDPDAYKIKRAAAYAQIEEQLDLLYHDMAADKGDKTGEWFKHIKAVKDANSKE